MTRHSGIGSTKAHRLRGSTGMLAMFAVVALALSGCGVVKAIEHKAFNELTGPQQGVEQRSPRRSTPVPMPPTKRPT